MQNRCISDGKVWSAGMREILITIDGGTTNTRCVFWKFNEMILEEKMRTGIRDAVTKKTKSSLEIALRNTLDNCLKKLSCTWEDISGIVVSGMLTSENGLCEVPYIQVPVSLEELADNMYCKQITNICPKPIWFIPGIKNALDDEICGMDMMRGEETESIELMRKYGFGYSMLLILPGSHNKIIQTDEKKNICRCLTTMSGEMLYALSNHTILSSVLNDYYVNIKNYDESWILKGARMAEDKGLCRAAFEVRIQEIIEKRSKDKLANYLLGAILSQDMLALKKSGMLHCSNRQNIVISGSNKMVDAWKLLFAEMMPDWKVIVDRTPQLSGRGAKRVFEYRMK